MNKREVAVQEFHEVFGHPVGDGWSPKNLDLRMNLMKEELAEVGKEVEIIKDYIEMKNHTTFDLFQTVEFRGAVTNLVKELADLQYVLSGFVVSSGIQGFFDEAFDEVHRSNMSKLEDGKVLRREDGKILKGKNYQPATMKHFWENLKGKFQ